MSRFIVIEGLIGVGKTSLCRVLEREWNARLVLEPWDDNPFLAAFYNDPERFAFAAQMFYLASRYSQQLAIAQGELFSDLVVSDYLYAKDRIFAEQTLNDDELALYDRFVELLGGRMPRPDFVLFLDAPTEVIQERIRKRGIHVEQGITSRYLDTLRERYYALWDTYDDAPVYVLDTTDLDYTAQGEARRRVLAMLSGWLDGRPLPGAPQAYRRHATGQLDLFSPRPPSMKRPRRTVLPRAASSLRNDSDPAQEGENR